MVFDFEDSFVDELLSSASKSLLVYGDNTDGQLLSDNKTKLSSPKILQLPISTIDGISTGSSHTFIRQGSLLYCCGNNFFGQLGMCEVKKQCDFEIIDFFNKRSEPLRSVICGYNQTFFLTEQGKVYGCGFNEEGCLGIIPNSNVYNITEVKIPGGKSIQKIAIGMYHVLMLSDDDQLMVSGLQNQGQLFLDTKTKNQKALIINKEMSVKELQEIGCGQYYSIAFSKKLKIFVSGVLNGGNTPVFLEFDLNKEFGFSMENSLPLLTCSLICCDDWFLVRSSCEFNLFLEKDYFFKWVDGKVKDVTICFNNKINEEVVRVCNSRKVMALTSKSGKLFYLTNSDKEIVGLANEPSLFFISVSHPFLNESLLDDGLLAVVGN
ncbi:predicted protein [Naegleria gruberi]|uniref:Predicted protein n=1 Tax=Naegleria gruberi TaxID=5762 RepID=D2V931_NAEGR|nr:uncharacterized protein NAEGRDRAFT_65547 [Naegleria gruberi]EFC46637.1 predicted protein [Naegleria gruberi]|eukprot:XP_002679381.1 predicted protein [Naegleria gruberi strain NEG-M]